MRTRQGQFEFFKDIVGQQNVELPNFIVLTEEEFWAKYGPPDKTYDPAREDDDDSA